MAQKQQCKCFTKQIHVCLSRQLFCCEFAGNARTDQLKPARTETSTFTRFISYGIPADLQSEPTKSSHIEFSINFLKICQWSWIFSSNLLLQRSTIKMFMMVFNVLCTMQYVTSSVIGTAIRAHRHTIDDVTDCIMHGIFNTRWYYVTVFLWQHELTKKIYWKRVVRLIDNSIGANVLLGHPVKTTAVQRNRILIRK